MKKNERRIAKIMQHTKGRNKHTSHNLKRTYEITARTTPTCIDLAALFFGGGFAEIELFCYGQFIARDLTAKTPPSPLFALSVAHAMAMAMPCVMAHVMPRAML